MYDDIHFVSRSNKYFLWMFSKEIKDLEILVFSENNILSQGLYLGLDYRIIGKSMFLCGLQSRLQVHVV